MSIDAPCQFCGGHAFATRALFIHPYTPEELELIGQIDQDKLKALRVKHDGWLIACYKCLAAKCPKEEGGTAVTPRPSNSISTREP